MTEQRDLLAPLRAAGEALSRANLSHAARQRIGDRLAEAAAAPRRRSALLPGVALALAAGIAVWLMVARDRAQPQPAAEPTVAPAAPGAAGRSFAWEGLTCSAAEQGPTLTADGGCRVRVDQMGMSISSRAEVELVRLDDGVRLARGSAEFEVAHRDSRQPVRVWVSGGSIEVTGTRFTVHQHARGGHVDLIDGGIRFRATDGTTTAIRPGTRFVWLDRPPPAPARDATPPAPEIRRQLPRPPRPPRAPRPARDPRVPISGDAAARAIEDVQALRAERRYRDAARLLRHLRAANWDRSTAEVLSFEEGDVLEHLGDDRAACAHWRAHQARFPGGTYRAAIERAQRRLRCR
jgi:ferric-dicitrate binding protein FerR (iron transport regulator)